MTTELTEKLKRLVFIGECLRFGVTEDESVKPEGYDEYYAEVSAKLTGKRTPGNYEEVLMETEFWGLVDEVAPLIKEL